ncbi:MAG: sugar phosphate nucleotidyltransferase [Pirellulaceae bacterium]|nr:sugar phosphate nucleotidyltransferase [Pirellulaceae bacterium]
MTISKAVITAAGKDQTHLPLQTVVDRTGRARSALELVLEEVVSAGIEDIAIVVAPGEKDRYLAAAGSFKSRLTFFVQNDPQGYGDAILRAQAFVGREMFLHLVGDHLYVSDHTQLSCASQLVAVAQREQCSISAIQPTHESKLRFFGAIGGTPVAHAEKLYEVTAIMEKPTPTQAEQALIVAGQRSGYYLCFFGMHVLTPTILDLLAEAKSAFAANLAGNPAGTLAGKPMSVNLSDSLRKLIQREKYLAFQIQGQRFNIGETYGLLIAQMALALSGPDRDRVLVELVELLARPK